MSIQAADYKGPIMGLLSLTGIVLIWQGAVSLGLIRPFFVSSPTLVATETVAMLRSGELARHFSASAISFLIAFSASAIAGITLGTLSGWYRPVEKAFDPFVWFLYSIPAIAFYPLFIAWFGFGRPTAIAVAIMFALTPIYANTMTGVKNISPDLVRMAQSFGARPHNIFIRIALPSSIPLIVGGLQLGVGRVLAGIVIAELFGANAGLGYSIAYYAQYMQTTKMMVFIVVIIASGLVLTQGMAAISAMTARWRS